MLICSSGGGGRSASKRSRTATEEEEEEEEEDLTADMEDPPAENAIAEVKVTAANAGKSDMQPSKPGSSYMDVDEAQEAQNGGAKEDKEDNDDNVTEQTHHIIVPSYRFVPSYV